MTQLYLFGSLQLNQLTEELSCVRAEKEQSARSSAEETEEQLFGVIAERDQLRKDLQENEQMVSESLSLSSLTNWSGGDVSHVCYYLFTVLCPCLSFNFIYIVCFYV